MDVYSVGELNGDSKHQNLGRKFERLNLIFGKFGQFPLTFQLYMVEYHAILPE
jgi:hypothetical protein